MSEVIHQIFQFLGYLFLVAGWIIVFILIFNAYQYRRKRKWLEAQKYTTLLIQVPKNNEKSPLAAELMFASLHGIFRPLKERLREGSFQEHISFEIVSVNKFIRFYVHTPVHLRDFVEGQIYAQYPTVEISEVDDYTESFKPEKLNFIGTELLLTKPEFYPIKTFSNFEVDPLAGITAVLGKLDESEQVWVQLLARPSDDSWQARSIAYINALKQGRIGGRKLGILIGFIKFLISLAKLVVAPPSKAPEEKKLPGPVEQAIKAIEDKATKLGFEVKIRLLLISDKDPLTMKTKLSSVVGAFKQFNIANLNGFTAGKFLFNQDSFLQDYKGRVFVDKGFVLNIEELASIYHLPNVTVETPNIVWAGAKKGEPPSNLPIEGSVPAEELTVFAQTDFRHAKHKFGIKTDDRRRHIYVIGKTGMGKTTMFENMVINDILAGRGVGVVDPHGEFIDTLLDYIPKERIQDVILFRPGDREYPIGFNLLQDVSHDFKGIVASGVVGIFKKIFAESWGPRLEYILRNTILALLDYPGATLLGINRMLTDKDYRKEVVKHILDPVIRDFWIKEYASYDQKFRTEAIAPIQNKVGQFLSTSTIRNIVGQSESTFNIREAMDNKKILLVKLAKGEIGEDNAALLGAMIITKIQLAAMSRIDTPEEDRVDFYLYVDEFQNFATEAFATILSEARKYRLNLALANQYIAQMPDKVRDAIFGNVGTIISFRVGPQDAAFLEKEFEPVFDANDLINLDKYHIYIKLAVDGVTTPAFSATTLPLPTKKFGYKDEIIKASRERYTRPREEIEEAIKKWAEPIVPERKIEKEKFEKIVDIRGEVWYRPKYSEKEELEKEVLKEGEVVDLNKS